VNNNVFFVFSHSGYSFFPLNILIMFFRLCRIFCCTLVLVSSLKSFFLKKVVVITLWVAHGDARIYSDSRSSLAIWVHDFFFFSVVVLVVKCR